MKDKRYPLVRRFCAVAVGVVFFVAGMLKLMDPVGATLKVQDYLNYFHFTFLGGVARPVSIALAMLEVICGAALISGVWRKVTAVVTGVLLVFFTALTAILFFTKADLDCGCFGEAVHMSPLQTFLKNIVLCCLAAVAFLPAGYYDGPRKTKYAGFGVAALCAIGLCVYSLDNLPLVDHTGFAAGNTLISASSMPSEGASEALMLVDENGWGRDDRLLYGKQMVVSVYNPAEMGAADWASVSAFLEDIYGTGFRPCLAVSADGRENVPDYIEVPVFTADSRKLVALNRSNGGVTYIEDGLIVCKWNLRDAPDNESLKEVAQKNSTEVMVERSTRPKLVFEGLVSIPLALMLII